MIENIIRTRPVISLIIFWEQSMKFLRMNPFPTSWYHLIAPKKQKADNVKSDVIMNFSNDVCSKFFSISFVMIVVMHI